MKKTQVAPGISFVDIPEARLGILCGCPENSVKFLMKAGIILPSERNGVTFETGPNAILLSELPVQGGRFSNLGEFPVLQMLYRQGMILPGHPNNTGRRPMLIGLRAQVEAQSRYIYLGNYGLTSTEDLVEAGMDEEEARDQLRMKLTFAFGAFRNTEDLLDLRIIDADAIELSEGAFLRRLGVNRYEFIHGGTSVTVDLSLETGERYGVPYTLPRSVARKEAFSVVHVGEGDGWDPGRPCMGSVVMFRGKPYLVDAGPNIKESLESVGIAIDDLAGIFHTHAHDDHFVGLTALILARRRIDYFAVPWVRASVARKLAAVSGIAESDFRRYFNVRDLEEGTWNDVDGLAVFPVSSPHPLENTILKFRAGDGNKHYTYSHLADLTSVSVLEGMVTDDPSLPGISRALATSLKASWLEPADVKKIDAGGGMIHGEAPDFDADTSGVIFVSHAGTPPFPPSGRVASFGEETVLIAAPEPGYPEVSPEPETDADPKALLFLEASPVFADLGKERLATLAANAERVIRASGEPLLVPGFGGLFMIETGVASLVSGGRLVSRLSPGDISGEEGLLSEAGSVMEVTAEGTVSGWTLPQSDVESVPLLLWRLREIHDHRLALARNVFDFRWMKEYAVNVPLIDEQHRTLFGMLGKIARELTSGQRHCDLREELAGITAFTTKHFSAEMVLMKEASYPGTSEHERLHETILSDFRIFLDRFDPEDEEKTGDLIAFMKDCLLKHTLEEDRRYIPWLSRP